MRMLIPRRFHLPGLRNPLMPSGGRARRELGHDTGETVWSASPNDQCQCIPFRYGENMPLFIHHLTNPGNLARQLLP